MHSLWFHRQQRCSTQNCLMFVLELRCAHQCWMLVGHVLRTSVCAVVMSVRYTSYGVRNVSRERDLLVLASVHEIVTWPKYTCIWAVRDAVQLVLWDLRGLQWHQSAVDFCHCNLLLWLIPELKFKECRACPGWHWHCAAGVRHMSRACHQGTLWDECRVRLHVKCCLWGHVPHSWNQWDGDQDPSIGR
jgi:hypothetical protein